MIGASASTWTETPPNPRPIPQVVAGSQLVVGLVLPVNIGMVVRLLASRTTVLTGWTLGISVMYLRLTVTGVAFGF